MSFLSFFTKKYTAYIFVFMLPFFLPTKTTICTFVFMLLRRSNKTDTII